MNNKNQNLSQFFPMIRTKTMILDEINSNPALCAVFNNWRHDQQEYFLSICSGNKGVKMLFDSYFKEILSPELTPARLSALLSILIGRKVKVKYQLPNDNSRLGDEMSLVITDIVVELEDGTIANVEVQKLGYAFTGERASCYSADLLLRQYKRVRDSLKENFSYKDIAPVYTIVFLETSPKVFKEFRDQYVHTFFTVSDTGLSLNMLQNFIFIPVDIFLEKLHNEGVQSELDAWLTFLGCDEPEYIIKLIQQYPYFKALYEDLYNMCLNTERMMNMFSEELKILDRNTVKYMMDEIQEQLDNAEAQLSVAITAIEKKDKTIDDQATIIAEQRSTIAEQSSTIAEQSATIARLKTELDALKDNE